MATTQVTNQELTQFGADDEGNAQAARLLHGNELLYTDGYGWLFHNGSHWSRDGGEAAVNRAITETLKERRIAAAALENPDMAIIAAAKPNRGRVKNAAGQLADILHTPIEAFDSHPDLLNVKNGALNLKTGKLQAHDPSQRFTYCLPVDYDPNASTAAWERFLTGSLGAGAAELMPFLQMAVGYSLTGHTREERLFYLFGPPRSGKGTFSETLLELTGKPLGAGVRFDMLTRNREGDANSADLASLRPCRFITASESSRLTALNPAVIKQLTGGDLIHCALKYRDHFDYRPKFKLWLTSNWPLSTDVDDDAAWGRVYVVEFPNGHLGSEDKTLKARMRSPEILRGVLAWAVAGAMRWYASPNGLTAPPAVELATQRHRAELDTVQQFLDESTKRVEGARLTNPRLYAAYSDWCEENGFTPRKQKSLTQSLKAKGLVYDVQWIKGRAQRAWFDVDLLTEEVPL
jgi:putative DNA primase/helicase